MTLYNLEQLIKVRLYTNLKPRFEFYQTEKRGWFNRIKTEEGVYSMLGFSGCVKLNYPPEFTYVADNTLYYYPHIDYHFADGSTKSQYFKDLDDADRVFNNLINRYSNLDHQFYSKD